MKQLLSALVLLVLAATAAGARGVSDDPGRPGALLKAGAASAVPCTQYGPYPFVQGGCLNSNDLNASLGLSPGPLPPQNNIGQGALQWKYWLDTSTTPATLRMCIKAGSCSAAFNGAEWLTWATVDTSTGAIVWSSALFSGVAQLGTLPFPTPLAGSQVQIVGDTGIAKAYEVSTFGASGVFRYVRSDGTYASPLPLSAGEEIGAFGAFGNTAAGARVLSARVASVALGTAGPWSNTSTPTDTSFWTTPVGSTSPVRAFRVGSSGQLYAEGTPGANQGPVGSVNATQIYRAGSLYPAPLQVPHSSMGGL